MACLDFVRFFSFECSLFSFFTFIISTHSKGTQANAKEGLLFALERLRRDGNNTQRLACYASCTLKEATKDVGGWAAPFLIQHDAHKEILKLLLKWSEDATVMSWLVSVIKNMASSSACRKDLLDIDLVKTMRSLLINGILSRSEFNIQTAVCAYFIS